MSEQGVEDGGGEAQSSATLKDLMRQRSYVFFWFTRFFGTTANQMLMVAIGWHMYDITNSAWDLGLVGLFQFVPALLFSLPAGHWVDRWHRGKIVACCFLLQVGVSLFLMEATAGNFADRNWMLAMSVVLGICRAFQMPAAQALAPSLVPSRLLPRAMALSGSGMQAAIIGGPALGGLIYVSGAVAVYASCAALFFLGCLLILNVKYAPKVKLQREPTTWRTVWAGMTFICSRRVLLGTISLDLFAVLLGGAVALLPIFAKDILHVGPFGLGVLRSAPAVGALTISVILARWPIERWPGRKMLWAVGIFGVSMVVFGFSRWAALSMVALVVSGAADMVNVVVRQSMLQLETPDEMRGRVSSVNSVFIGASNELGEFESGSAAALLGPVWATVLGGVGTVVVVLWWIRLFPELWRQEEFFIHEKNR